MATSVSPQTQQTTSQTGQQQGTQIPIQGQQQFANKDHTQQFNFNKDQTQQFNTNQMQQQQFQQHPQRSAWDDVHSEFQRSRNYIGTIPEEGQQMMGTRGGQYGGGAGMFNPFRELIRMQRRIDNMLDQGFWDFPIPGFGDFGSFPMIGQQGMTGTGTTGKGKRGGVGGGQMTIARPMVDWHPVCDVKENDREVIVHAELPGVDKDKVKLDVSHNILTVSGERSNVNRMNQDRYHCTERTWGSFTRSIALPEGVDPTSINATYKDGVLEVVVPKPTKTVPGKTSIQIK